MNFIQSEQKTELFKNLPIIKNILNLGNGVASLLYYPVKSKQ